VQNNLQDKFNASAGQVLQLTGLDQNIYEKNKSKITTNYQQIKVYESNVTFFHVFQNSYGNEKLLSSNVPNMIIEC